MLLSFEVVFICSSFVVSVEIIPFKCQSMSESRSHRYFLIPGLFCHWWNVPVQKELVSAGKAVESEVPGGPTWHRQLAPDPNYGMPA